MSSRFSFPFDAGPFVWLLLLLAFLALVFVVERAMFLHRGLVLSSDFIEGVRNNLRAGRPLEALAACEESPGPVPRVVKAALLRSGSGEDAMRAAATKGFNPYDSHEVQSREWKSKWERQQRYRADRDAKLATRWLSI